jgi:hypothetical protein
LTQRLEFLLLATAQSCSGGLGLSIMPRSPGDRLKGAQKSYRRFASIAVSAGQCRLRPQDRLIEVAPGLPNEGDPKSIWGSSWVEHLAFPPGVLRAIQVSRSQPHIGQQAPGEQQVRVIADHLIHDGLG